MRILHDFSVLRRKRRAVALAAGFFDGVHRGHRRVIRQTVLAARALGGEAWALSFAAHPLRVLRPGAAPPLLSSARHRARMLAGLGVDGCLMIPFTRRLASMEPEAFVRRLLGAAPTLRRVLAGGDWRFGRGGRGDIALFRRLAAERGVRVAAVPPVLWRGRPVSSTRVRGEIAAGRLACAAAMLGRPFSVLGVVTRGRTVGRTLGYPTANLAVENEALPPFGVYAVLARAGARRRLLPGVLNIGVRPTFGGRGGCHVELHLLDFRADLYGAEVEVFFVRRLRRERRFASTAALREQIGRDAAAARRALRRAAAKKVEETLCAAGSRVL
jgi:riboflavin kinase/FMN adenylyltransferase